MKCESLAIQCPLSIRTTAIRTGVSLPSATRIRSIKAKPSYTSSRTELCIAHGVTPISAPIGSSLLDSSAISRQTPTCRNCVEISPLSPSLCFSTRRLFFSEPLLLPASILRVNIQSETQKKQCSSTLTKVVCEEDPKANKTSGLPYNHPR